MAEERKITRRFKPVFVEESELPTLFVNVLRGFVIDIPGVGRARVLNSFYIKMQRAEKGFIAVSDISDVYELGKSASQAIINYLFSLVDELIWFQKRKESLSRSLFKDFAKLGFYVGLV